MKQEKLRTLSTRTTDDVEVVLRANLELEEELPLLERYNAQGIGLYRTEMLFLAQGKFPGEDEQCSIYKGIVEATRPHSVTFRLFDLGGDKMLPLGHREQNPFLGWRGIRILLDRPEILEPQLRALLRATANERLRIMLPMVTNLDEVFHFKEVLEHTQNKLVGEGFACNQRPEIGIMVEVPGVAVRAHIFAPEVDFFSIGTNDLTQYTLAVDRGNEMVCGLYEELNPSVLSLIDMTVKAALENDIPVSICGEMAARPQSTPLLLGMGIRELSASPMYLSEVKRVIRSISIQEAEELARFALSQTGAAPVRAELDRWLREHRVGILQRLETLETES